MHTRTGWGGVGWGWVGRGRTGWDWDRTAGRGGPGEEGGGTCIVVAYIVMAGKPCDGLVVHAMAHAQTSPPVLDAHGVRQMRQAGATSK